MYILKQVSKSEKQRLLVAVYFTVLYTLFSAIFEQAGSSLTLFADRNVNLIGIEAGYRIPTLKNFNLSFLAGIGAIEYRNDVDGELFEDTGEAYSLMADADYKFSRHFSAFLTAEYRYESLNTKAPNTTVAFNKASYIALSFGIRFYFLNERD
jgi:hypothetical protein